MLFTNYFQSTLDSTEMIKANRLAKKVTKENTDTKQTTVNTPTNFNKQNP